MLVEGQPSSALLAGEGDKADTSLGQKQTHQAPLQSQWLLHFTLATSKLKGKKENFDNTYKEDHSSFFLKHQHLF